MPGRWGMNGDEPGTTRLILYRLIMVDHFDFEAAAFEVSQIR